MSPDQSQLADPRSLPAWVKERQESSGSKTTGLGDKVQDLFRNFAFSPLPLALSYDHGTITITERASVEELALLRKSKSSLNVTAATANDGEQRDLRTGKRRVLTVLTLISGCVLSEDEVESRIIHIVRCFDQDLHIPSCKVRTPRSKAATLHIADLSRWTCLPSLQSLKIHGVVKISRQFARTCISAVTNPLAYRNGQSELEQEWGSVYTILVHLDRKHTLPFRLSEIIEEVLLPEQDGAVTPRMLFFVERLQHDFPNLPCVNALFGPAMFLKAERQHIQHIDEIKQLMGNYQVTTQDIMAVCLRNHCRTVTSIQYGLRHVKGFDLSHFMAELIQKLLNQPYRGIMLRELDRFFAQRVGLIDFRSMLVLAVEKQGELVPAICRRGPTLKNMTPSFVQLSRTLRFHHSSGTSTAPPGARPAIPSHHSARCSRSTGRRVTHLPSISAHATRTQHRRKMDVLMRACC